MTNKKIARFLSETSALIELSGGNAFRANAFQRAARIVERLEEPVADLLAAGTLQQLPSIGAGLVAQIQELLDYGSFELRDELLAALPPGLPDVLRVKGLGPKKVYRLWKELGITNLEELEQAATTGRLASLEGFGVKTQENILENLSHLKNYQTRRHYAVALAHALPVLEMLRAHPQVVRAELTGALRRALETVEAAHFLVASDDPETLAASLTSILPAQHHPDKNQLSGTIADGLPLTISWVKPENFASAWWHSTGSEAHLQEVLAIENKADGFADEASFYQSRGLDFIEPELREGRGEVEAARQGSLPTLLTLQDLRGTLHNHSTYSDGAHTLRQMAERAREMGLSYFGICDHSQSLKIANGMPVDRIRRQQEEIQRLNAEYASDGKPPFRIFSGIESDILADGSLDYDDDVLASFDFVVASIHSRFNMSEAEATERVLRAIANPYTTILGHPTGRLLLAREGYPLDFEAVLDACATHGVAIELNAHPYRLDLDWRWVHQATTRGILISINPDAHSMDELDNVRWGVAVARKGWLTPAQCLNAKSCDDFAAWLATHRTASML